MNISRVCCQCGGEIAMRPLLGSLEVFLPHDVEPSSMLACEGKEYTQMNVQKWVLTTAPHLYARLNQVFFSFCISLLPFRTHRRRFQARHFFRQLFCCVRAHSDLRMWVTCSLIRRKAKKAYSFQNGLPSARIKAAANKDTSVCIQIYKHCPPSIAKALCKWTEKPLCVISWLPEGARPPYRISRIPNLICMMLLCEKARMLCVDLLSAGAVWKGRALCSSCAQTKTMIPLFEPCLLHDHKSHFTPIKLFLTFKPPSVII